MGMFKLRYGIQWDDVTSAFTSFLSSSIPHFDLSESVGGASSKREEVRMMLLLAISPHLLMSKRLPCALSLHSSLSLSLFIFLHACLFHLFFVCFLVACADSIPLSTPFLLPLFVFLALLLFQTLLLPISAPFCVYFFSKRHTHTSSLCPRTSKEYFRNRI